MNFVTYTNRYGKQIILMSWLREAFYAMQANLGTQNIDIEMTDGWRGQAEQESDFARGVSKAHFGQSAHNYGAAFDCAPIINGTLSWPPLNDTWKAIALAGQSQGLTWGGTFTTIVDLPHFEDPDWQSYALQNTAPAVTEV